MVDAMSRGAGIVTGAVARVRAAMAAEGANAVRAAPDPGSGPGAEGRVTR